MRSNKIYLRRLSFILCFAFIIVTINIFSKNANATVFDKPHFTMSIDSISPSPAKVGEDIIIKGTITPQDFENVIQKKQIVLVIDVSGSMEGNKISNLKTAAKNFVTKMSTVSNAEIAIIAFSDKGTINPYLDGYKDSFVPLINLNVEKIKNCIQSLNANGATNTGDGLRNAAYLLDQNSESASKTIVFMSDGEPTKYVRYNTEKGWVLGTYTGNYIYNSSGDKYAWNESYLPSGYSWGYGTFNGYKYGYTYYTNIKSAGFDSNVGTYGPGSSDDNDGNCLNYAKTIGQIIKDKGYNVFSIGYGLNQSGTTKMKAIHSSMSNSIDNYFATDTGAIDGVYNAIADKIINSYTLDNLAINLNLSSDFTLNYGGNVVNIQNITYTKDPKITNKIVYHAEPIPFQFTIKGNKPVKDYNVLQGAKLIVPWNGSEIADTSMPKAEVTIIENDLPKINVHLSKIDVNNQSFAPNQNIIANSGEKIKVTYQIDTDPFEYNINNSIGGMIDEAVFVVDLSKNMGDGNRWQMMQNWFTNILLNGNQTIKLGVVGYNDDVIHPIDNGEYDRLFNRNNSTERETLRRFLQEPNSTQHESIYPEDNSNRNIGPALKKADYLLQFKGEPNKNKAIVLVNSGDVSYSQSDIDAIKNNGYMVISVDLSCDKNQNTISNLKILHSSLLGNDNDYFVSRNDGDNFNSTQVEMQKIADRLKSGMASRELIVTGAQLNFDLGENFEATANSGLDGAGKIRTIDLPDIKYTLVKSDAGDYEWTQMAPNPIEVSFDVQIVQEKSGRLGFANDSDSDSPNSLKNYVSYERFDGISIKKHIDTPIVTTNGIPNIKARLDSVNGSKYSPNMMVNTFPIRIGYEISTDPFEYNTANSGFGLIDEAVFLMDLSHTSNTANGARTRLMDPWFEKILINDEGNIFQSQNIKYGIVGYNGADEYPKSGSGYDKLFNPEVTQEKDALISSISNIKDAINKNNSSQVNDIAYELEKADKLFTNGLENSRKAIVLVNAENVDSAVSNSAIVNKINAKGYKIISLNMNWSPGQQKKSNLSALHSALGGKSTDYITSERYNPGQGGSPQSDMTEISKRLNPGTSSTISMSNVKLNFDLGENFKAVEDGALGGNGKIRTITIPRIDYTLKLNSTSGKYMWHQTYPSEKFYINFNVNVESNKLGKLGFGSYTNQDIKYSTISYEDLNDMQVSKNIETPLITVNQMNIEHGVYEGIQNGKPSIYKSERTFRRGSIVSMAASFDFFSNTTIKLELAPNIVKYGDIIINKVNVNGDLIPIGTMTGDGSNYQAAIGNELAGGDKILVRYDVKLPDIDGHYTNFIQVGDSDKIPGKIAVSGELPDLF